MLRPERKKAFAEFPLVHNYPVVILISVFFLFGLLLSVRTGIRGVSLYLISWAISYIVLYSGACRRCPYYGRKCPIPLEGSCVHLFYGPRPEGFGWSALIWATAAYALRIAVPSVILFREGLLVTGLAYFGWFCLFWIVHLRKTGCPHCANRACPLNPEYPASGGPH